MIVGKVLLVDTNFSSQPIYSALIKLGYEVHVVGREPSDALAKEASKYWQIDYSDRSELQQLIEDEGYDFIVPGCTDLSYSSCAYISQGRYPGIENTVNDVLINRKNKFRQLAERLKISVPKTFSVEDDLPFPVIVKPVDSFSGKGITIVDHVDLLNPAIESAKEVSSTGCFIVEEFIAGQLFSHSAFIENSKVVMDFVVREDSTANRFVVDVSTLSDEVSNHHLGDLRASIERLAAELDLKDGLLHTQFMYTGEQFYLIEMTRRCPGDLYSQLIELQTGFPYVENYVRPFLGLKLNIPPLNSEVCPVIRHTVSSNRGQVFTGLKFHGEFIIEMWVPLAITGDWLDESPRGRAGIVFIGCQSNDDLKSAYSKFIKRQAYHFF